MTNDKQLQQQINRLFELAGRFGYTKIFFVDSPNFNEGRHLKWAEVRRLQDWFYDEYMIYCWAEPMSAVRFEARSRNHGKDISTMICFRKHNSQKEAIIEALTEEFYKLKN